MRNHVAIEDIEELRQKQGIDDVELRMEIRGLKVGDLVRLTLLGKASSETLPVRITSISGATFRGKLASRPTDGGSFELPANIQLAFTANHIHSVPKARAVQDDAPLRRDRRMSAQVPSDGARAHRAY